MRSGSFGRASASLVTSSTSTRASMTNATVTLVRLNITTPPSVDLCNLSTHAIDAFRRLCHAESLGIGSHCATSPYYPLVSVNPALGDSAVHAAVGRGLA